LVRQRNQKQIELITNGTLFFFFFKQIKSRITPGEHLLKIKLSPDTNPEKIFVFLSMRENFE
jgi:hypothetical protein